MATTWRPATVSLARTIASVLAVLAVLTSADEPGAEHRVPSALGVLRAVSNFSE